MPIARHHVGTVLTAAGHRNVCNAQLVVTELVANAIMHSASGLAGGLVTVDLTALTDDLARIDVIDQGASTMPKVCMPSDAESSGRGLWIVERTALRWGVLDDALGGTAVWAVVLTADDPTHNMPKALIWAADAR
ncbi:ATP-binding protein [Nonomuraea sp. NPDC050404]|uniref:ATP-binding protein n=1 Tax=Nonomuraea sp. NPDC050404 TaxID=3155783 RepID=UPI0033F12E7D